MAAAITVSPEPHHDGSPLYVSSSSPRLGDVVRLHVRVPANWQVRSLHVRSTPDAAEAFVQAGIDEERTGSAVAGYGSSDTWWTAEVAVANPVTRYRFLINTPTGVFWLCAAGVVDHEPTDATDFRLVTYGASADWTAEAVVYEIIPDRFAQSSPLPPADELPDWAVPARWDEDEVIASGPLGQRQLFGGDLDGIAAHLDHLRALGADTIYLRPVFPAESNHRYNATTFDDVDPILGGTPALRRLSDAVHAAGMRLVGDITTNHCGDTHEWFVTARTSPQSAERSMFYFEPDGSYVSWYGVQSLPKLNWGSPLVRRRMAEVVKRWLTDYDGWRVDVANMTGRYRSDDLTREVAAELRRTVRDVRPDAAFVGEHMFDASGDLDAGGWDGTMNYSGFTRPLWSWLRGGDGESLDFLGMPGGIPVRSGPAAVASIRTFSAAMSWQSLTRSWLVLDSFDSPRIRTIVGSADRHAVAAGLQATLPGVPMICAGTEWGLQGRFGEEARTPMPWNRPAERDEDTFALYRTLFGLRAAEPALRGGGLRWLHVGDDVLAYARETADETLVMVAQRDSAPALRLPLDRPLAGVHAAPDLPCHDGHVEVPATPGPAFRIWRTR